MNTESTHKKKVLIVEDDYVSFRFISRLLENNNFFVMRADNGKQAVELFKENPDILMIFMDIRMPVLDGIEATKQIKALNPAVPIIAQTAYAFKEEKAIILSAGCDACITKPIDIDELTKLIFKFS